MRTAPQQKIDRIQALLDGATTQGERVAAYNAKKRVIRRHFTDPNHPLLTAKTAEELYEALKAGWDFKANTGPDSATLTAYLEMVDHDLLKATHAHMEALGRSWWTKGVYTGPMVKAGRYEPEVSLLKFNNCTEWLVGHTAEQAN